MLKKRTWTLGQIPGEGLQSELWKDPRRSFKLRPVGRELPMGWPGYKDVSSAAGSSVCWSHPGRQPEEIWGQYWIPGWASSGEGETPSAQSGVTRTVWEGDAVTERGHWGRSSRERGWILWASILHGVPGGVRERKEGVVNKIHVEAPSPSAIILVDRTFKEVIRIIRVGL